MQETLQRLIAASLNALQQQAILPDDHAFTINIERTRDSAHGDFASNIALMLAKTANMPPRDLAQRMIAEMPSDTHIERIELAGPGFINFYIKRDKLDAIVADILAAKDAFGQSAIGHGKNVLIEYVSCNPTGPLHVGHGRQAAYGACMANLLQAVGYDVSQEYYVNDAGRQMQILAVSTWLRYLALHHETIYFPKNGYQGDYICDIAQDLRDQYDDAFVVNTEGLYHGLPLDLQDDGRGDKEAYIDALIMRTKELIGEARFQEILTVALDAILDDIKQDLSEFGVVHDTWFSEKSLMTSDAIHKSIDVLKQAGLTYEQDGALWFKALQFGDEKDRVLIRANGQSTYFASDVAYHWNKYQRGFDHIIDILGADHHGYVPRLQAVIKALGENVDSFDTSLVQFVSLYRDGKKVQMSTRSGSFVTLRELREEVGNDAARLFYVMRKNEQHLDFDLSLAKSQSNDNPVYYIQYAHARICSVMRQLTVKQWQWDETAGLNHLSLLNTEHEQNLLRQLQRYPEVIVQAAQQYAPHSLVHYLKELASLFHAYYNSSQFLIEQAELRNARLSLIMAIAIVLNNGLHLLGVHAPESM